MILKLLGMTCAALGTRRYAPRCKSKTFSVLDNCSDKAEIRLRSFMYHKGRFCEQADRARLFLQQEPLAARNVQLATGISAMSGKFRPAPTDIHADTPNERAAADKKADDELKKGLKASFPASDPPSNTQPAKTANDAR